MTRIVVLSDTHNRHKKVMVPDGDILIHAGDATIGGTIGEIGRFLKWMGELPHEHKIFVAGNHDRLFELDHLQAQFMCLENNIIYLEDDGVELCGIKFWGSPVQPWFYDWAFNRARNFNEVSLRGVSLIKPHWGLIPNDTDFLITHGPAYGILDQLGTGDNIQFLGCVDLLNAIKRVKPKVHVCGHIHYACGSTTIDGTDFYNVSVCDEAYEPVNPVTVIDYGGKDD